jgi:hypothetical protein
VEMDSRRIRLDLLSHEGYNIYGLGDLRGWRRLGRNSKAAAPGVFTALCVVLNNHVGGGQITPMTNTIIIL